MQNIFKVIILIGDLLGAILFIVSFLGLRKILKQHKMLDNDDFLSQREEKQYRQYLIYSAIGFSIYVITSLIGLILLFTDIPF